jgi:alkylated DNA repair protein alkB family protein 7
MNTQHTHASYSSFHFPFCSFSIRRRRRYERGHWDAVIVKYKETELWEEGASGQHQHVRLSDTSRAVVEGLRTLLATNQHVVAAAADGGDSPVRWLAPHAIELHPEGELRAHVDSTRFSGGLVAGLSLATPAILRLQHPPEGDDKDTGAASSSNTKGRVNGHVDLLLPPRSLYALTGRSRYDYTHELLPDQAVFGGTGASIERKEHRWSIIFRDAKE